MCPKTQDKIDYMSKVPYSLAIDILMYVMVCTRMDITHAVGVVSRYIKNPGKDNWKELNWIIRYLRGNTTQSLCFGGSNTIIQEYVDSYMEGDIYSMREPQGMFLL